MARQGVALEGVGPEGYVLAGVLAEQEAEIASCTSESMTAIQGGLLQLLWPLRRTSA